MARMRINGILVDVFDFPKQLHSEIITRIKVLGGMRTDEHQAAQDGRFRMSIADLEKQFDVRVSIVHTYYGENGVLRLLAEQTAINSLDDLAFTHWLMQEAGVASVPGRVFYSDPAQGRSLVRFAFAKRLETLQDAADRLRAALLFRVRRTCAETFAPVLACSLAPCHASENRLEPFINRNRLVFF